MPSPTCTINGLTSVGGQDVTPATTVTIQLASLSGVDTWGITCIGTDELLVAATITASLTINSTTKTATFTAPVAGSALIFQSVVNGGVDVNGVEQSSYTTTFGLYTLATTTGDRVAAVNETTEGSASFGWLTKLNPILRDGTVAALADDSVTVAKLAEQTALSVIANATNGTANPTYLAAGTDAFVLRRSGTALAWGLLGTANLDPAAAITLTQLANGTALSVVGNGTNGSAAHTDLVAGSDGHIMRRSGTAVAFGTIVNAGIDSAAAIAYSKMGTGAQSLSAVSAFTTTVNAKGTAVDHQPVNVQTTDATVTTVDSFTLASNTAVVLSALVLGIKSDYTQAGAYSITACFRNNAGTVAQVGTSTTTVIGEDDAGWTATIDNSTTTIRVRVTGAVGDTVQWTSVFTRLEVIP